MKKFATLAFLSALAAVLVTFSATAALAIVMTLVGTLMPTIRALRVDPITALRTE